MDEQYKRYKRFTPFNPYRSVLNIELGDISIMRSYSNKLHIMTIDMLRPEVKRSYLIECESKAVLIANAFITSMLYINNSK